MYLVKTQNANAIQRENIFVKGLRWMKNKVNQAVGAVKSACSRLLGMTLMVILVAKVLITISLKACKTLFVSIAEAFILAVILLSVLTIFTVVANAILAIFSLIFKFAIIYGLILLINYSDRFNNQEVVTVNID